LVGEHAGLVTHLFDITASGEALPFAGENHAADTDVSVDAINGIDQCLDNTFGDGVTGFRFVQCQSDDMAALFILHCVCHCITSYACGCRSLAPAQSLMDR